MNTSIVRAGASIAIALIASASHAQDAKPASSSSATEAGAAPRRGYLVANYTIHDRETFQVL